MDETEAISAFYEEVNGAIHRAESRGLTPHQIAEELMRLSFETKVNHPVSE